MAPKYRVEANIPDASARRGLTDLQVRRAAPRAKPYRLTDRDGLFLWITPSGTKSWRTKYKIDGRESLITLGGYPEMGILAARAARLDIRKAVRAGDDPSHERRVARVAQLDRNQQTFEVMALRWHAYNAANNWTAGYAVQVLQRLRAVVFPAIGERPISKIRRRDVIELIEGIISVHGKHQGDHVRKHLVLAFDSWLDKELIDTNPADRLARRFPVPINEPHRAVSTVADARRVLAAFETRKASASVLLAHRLQALTGLRPTEARAARWSEFATPGVWSIPAKRMKGRRDRKRGHDVPLSPQAQDLIRVARSLNPAHRDDDPVFPGVGEGRPIARETISSLMKNALELSGLKHVPHGWRSAFATIMNERHPADQQVIDAMLAHAGGKGAVERLYNRSKHFERAREMANEWADLLLAEAPDPWTLVGLSALRSDNIVSMREVASLPSCAHKAAGTA
jgi:integrase